MSVDLSQLSDLDVAGGVFDIPINLDPVPYQQLGAHGRYPQQSLPNTLPPLLSVLSSLSKTDNTPDLLSTDGNRNLNVNIASGGGGGGTGGASKAQYKTVLGTNGSVNATFPSSGNVLIPVSVSGGASIVAIHYRLALISLTGDLDNVSQANLWFSGTGGDPFIDVANEVFGAISPAGAPFCVGDTIIFNPAINCATTFPSAGQHPNLNIDGSRCQFTFAVTVIAAVI